MQTRVFIIICLLLFIRLYFYSYFLLTGDSIQKIFYTPHCRKVALRDRTRCKRHIESVDSLVVIVSVSISMSLEQWLPSHLSLASCSYRRRDDGF